MRLRNLQTIITEDRTRPLGLVFALTAVGTALQIIRGSGMDHGSILMQSMFRVAPAWLWVMALLIVGIGEIVALARDSRPLRAVCAFSMILVWGYLAGASAYGAPYTIGPVAWALFALASAWAFVRLSRPRTCAP